jgi:hypothetical protein
VEQLWDALDALVCSFKWETPQCCSPVTLDNSQICKAKGCKSTIPAVKAKQLSSVSDIDKTQNHNRRTQHLEVIGARIGKPKLLTGHLEHPRASLVKLIKK